MNYLGPYVWDTTHPDMPDGHWRPPTYAPAVDLRSPAACAARGSHPGNVGFFATDAALGPEYKPVGTRLEGEMTRDQRDVWTSTFGLPDLDATTPLDALWELLTYRADPDGTSHSLPIMPTAAGVLELHLPDHGLVKSDRFTGTGHPSWPIIQRVLQDQYVTIRDRAILDSTDVHQRLLTTWMRKYKIHDHRLFIPDGVPVEEPLEPRTTLTESFNTGDSDTLGPDLTWNEVSGNWRVVSNTASRDGDGAQGSARAEHDLSSADHSTQLDVVKLPAAGAVANIGPASRFAGAAQTFYSLRMIWTGSGNVARLFKFVAGTPTQLGADIAWTPSLPDTPKVQNDGTSITGHIDGVLKRTVTDGTIGGNLRTGMDSFINAAHADDEVRADNFVGADIAAQIMPVISDAGIHSAVFHGLVVQR